MSRKQYIQPEAVTLYTTLHTALLQPSAPGEGIGYGGEGSDEDDPSTKRRNDDWGSLWN